MYLCTPMYSCARDGSYGIAQVDWTRRASCYARYGIPQAHRQGAGRMKEMGEDGDFVWARCLPPLPLSPPSEMLERSALMCFRVMRVVSQAPDARGHAAAGCCDMMKRSIEQRLKKGCGNPLTPAAAYPFRYLLRDDYPVLVWCLS